MARMLFPPLLHKCPWPCGQDKAPGISTAQSPHLWTRKHRAVCFLFSESALGRLLYKCFEVSSSPGAAILTHRKAVRYIYFLLYYLTRQEIVSAHKTICHLCCWKVHQWFRTFFPSRPHVAHVSSPFLAKMSSSGKFPSGWLRCSLVHLDLSFFPMSQSASSQQGSLVNSVMEIQLTGGGVPI